MFEYLFKLNLMAIAVDWIANNRYIAEKLCIGPWFLLLHSCIYAGAVGWIANLNWWQIIILIGTHFGIDYAYKCRGWISLGEDQLLHILVITLVGVL